MRQSAVEFVIITFSTLVQGYCCEGHVDHALRVVDEMKSLESFAPDEIMYNSLLNGCTKNRTWTRVYDFSTRCERRALLQLHAQHHGEALGKRTALQQAFQLVEDLSNQKGFRPNVQVYTCLTQACLNTVSTVPTCQHVGPIPFPRTYRS